jgi:17beta-estradiol 17-dehydrogenase / very-long-chain 3-oxoacyl-CoA reductase
LNAVLTYSLIFFIFFFEKVVTGSTDGIGRQYALELAKSGMHIMLISRTQSKLKEAAEEIGKFTEIDRMSRLNAHCSGNVQLTFTYGSFLLFNHSESTYAVKTKYIVADFSEGKHIYDNIRQQLQLLDVGVLVNNVGRMYDFPDDLDNISEDLLWQIININVGACTMLSRIVIPQMKINKRGIIVNISSGSECQPAPLMATYGASKVYVKNFTLGTLVIL